MSARRITWGIALVLLVSGCGRPARDPATVEFWTIQLSPTFDPFITSLIREFEAAHPGTHVRWVDVPFDGITQKFLSALASGNSPDVVNLPGDYVRKYVTLEAAAPLDALLPDSVRKSYLPSALASLVVDGSLYGIPWYLATKIMIYDRERLRAAGFGADAGPATFDSLLAFGREYYRRTGTYGFFYNLVVDSYLYQVLESEGVPVLSPDGRHAAFNSAAGKRVIQRWVDTFREGVLPRECLFEGHQGGIATYQSGTVAMFVGAPQFLRIVRENAPAIYARSGVAPSVAGVAGKTELDVMALLVSARSLNRPLAVEFASWVTNRENQLRFCRLVPIFPSIRSALDDPFFRTEDSTVESRARLVASVQIRTAEVLKPSLREYQRLNNVFKDQLMRAFLGTATVSDALDAAAAQWDKFLQEEW